MDRYISLDNQCMGSYGRACEIIEREGFQILCWYCHHERIPKFCLGITQQDTRCKREAENDYGYCRHHAKDWENDVVSKRVASRINMQITQIKEALETFDDYVYFIGCDGYVKIGHSKNPESRLLSLKSQADKTLRPPGIDLRNMKLIKKVKGGQRLESHLHVRLHNQRIVGEWFKHDTDVAHVIESYM
jgi:hypothetical protein